MNQNEDSRTESKWAIKKTITAAGNSSDNIGTNKITIKTRKQKWNKSNSMDISNNKEVIYHSRRHVYGYERDTLKEKLNLCHQDQSYKIENR